MFPKDQREINITFIIKQNITSDWGVQVRIFRKYHLKEKKTYQLNEKK